MFYRTFLVLPRTSSSSYLFFVKTIWLWPLSVIPPPPPSTGWYGSNLMGRRYIDARRLKCRWKHRDVPRMRRTIAQPIKVIFSRVRNFPRKSNYEIFCHCRSPGNSWYLWKNALFYLLSIPKLYFRSTVVISKEVFMKTFYARDKGLMTFWNSRIQQFL